MNGRVEIITGAERRRRWSDDEKLQLVAAACQAGNSVSQVARERGISANQLFGWRRQMLAKGLVTDNTSERSVAPALTFAPVEIAKEQPPSDAGGKVESARRQAATRISGSVEIELKGGDRLRVEACVDAGLVVRIISALRRGMITFPPGVRVWLATGHTDMRRGFPSLALMVQEQLKQDPYAGHLFIFRERRGALIKVIWICYSNWNLCAQS